MKCVCNWSCRCSNFAWKSVLKIQIKFEYLTIVRDHRTILQKWQTKNVRLLTGQMLRKNRSKVWQKHLAAKTQLQNWRRRRKTFFSYSQRSMKLKKRWHSPPPIKKTHIEDTAIRLALTERNLQLITIKIHLLLSPTAC